MQERVVEKKVFATGKSKKVTVKPDGTKTVLTKSYDKSTDTQTQNTKASTEETVEKNMLLLLGGKVDGAGVSYGVFLDKRLFGPVHCGVFVFTDKTYGINVGVQF